MAHERTLTIPEAYDPQSQRLAGALMAGLDDQTARTRGYVDGLETAKLEWQARPGRNTIGMLLAHMATCEVIWLALAAVDLTIDDSNIDRATEILGIHPNDDGVPLAKDGLHPDALRGWRLEQYYDVMDRGRAESHRLARGWTDAFLMEPVAYRDQPYTRLWMLYHVLEHQAAHLGQVALLLREMRER